MRGTLVCMNGADVQKKPIQFGRLLLGVTLSVIVVACGVLFLQNATSDLDQGEDMTGKVLVQVNGTELAATVVTLGTVDPETQTMVFGNEAMFVVFSEEENAPQLKLPDMSVDVVWLDRDFRVVLVERNLFYDEEVGNEVFEQPDGASYALIVLPIALSTDTIKIGDTVTLLSDPNSLLTRY